MQTVVEFSLLGVALVTGFFGVWLLIRGLLGLRAASGRRCPRCGYDMQGTEGLRCPECGTRAKNEITLRPRRRSWRRITASAFFIAITIGFWWLAHTAQSRGWKAAVPDTAWIIGVRLTDAELPMKELGFSGSFEIPWEDPTADLLGWQRSLLRSALYRRLASPRDDVRAAAMQAVGLLLPSREEMRGRDRALLERLCGDSNDEIGRLALTFLAQRIEAPESDPFIRSILDDPTRHEGLRAAALLGVLFRYGAESMPSPKLVEILLERLDDEGQPGDLAAYFAERIARTGLSDPRLVAPLLVRVQVTIKRQDDVTGRTLVAAWRHADAVQRTDVREVILEVLPKLREVGILDLFDLVRTADPPDDLRIAVLAAGLGNERSFIRREALKLCLVQPEEPLRALKPEITTAIERDEEEQAEGGFGGGAW